MTNENKPETGHAGTTVVRSDGGLYQSEFWSITRHELIASVAGERVLFCAYCARWWRVETIQ